MSPETTAEDDPTPAEHLRLALDSAHMIAWAWVPGQDAIKTSGNVAPLYGIAEITTAKQVFGMIHPDDRKAHRSVLETAVQSAACYTTHFRIIRADDGRVVWLEERATPILDASGAVTQLVGVVMDISQRKQADEVLAGQASLLDLTFDAILVRDFLTDEIRFWNRGAQELYGFSPHEVLGKVSHEALQTLHPVPVDEAKDSLVRTGRWEGELTHTRKDGRRIQVASRWAIELDGSRPVAILETNTDITARRATQAALTASEERYRTIVAVANEGVWLLDISGKTVYANERMAEMLGCDAEELQEKSVLDFTFEEDVTTRRNRIDRSLHGTEEQFDTRFRRADGSELLVLACTSPMLGAGGAITGAVGMFTDITQRVRTEHERQELLERAEEAQRRLSALADASSLLATSLDAEANLRQLPTAVVPGLADWCAIFLLDEEQGVLRMVGLRHRDSEREEALGDLPDRFEYGPSAQSLVATVLRSGRANLVTVATDDLVTATTESSEVASVLRSMGVTSWIVVPLEARGRRIGTMTLAMDVSHRRYGPEDVAVAEVLARRAALAVDNARLFQDATRLAAEQSTILSQMADAVVMVDAEGRLTYLNEAARQIVGEGEHASLQNAGDESRDRKPGESWAPSGAELPLSRALAQRETITEERWEIHRADGDTAVVQGSAAPLVATDGALLGAVSTFRDVTPQVALEEQKEDFLAAAAHDLRTPLTVLRGMTQLLERKLDRELPVPPHQLRDSLARIEESASRMTALIQDLVDLSNLRSGSPLELRVRPMDLVALTTTSIREFQTADGRIQVNARKPAVVGKWDPQRIQRVIANLLSNAVKYSDQDQPITVTIDSGMIGESEFALLTVRDRGIGIPAEDLSRVFDRFYRASNVGRQTFGTGIGLSGARHIVEQHGGTIEVDSTEGEGTTFTVRLPLRQS